MALAVARIRDIAQALVDDLNNDARIWSASLENPVTRTYRQKYDASDLDTLRVDVMGAAQDWPELIDRFPTEEQHCYLFVLIQKRVDWTDIATVDALVDLVSAIATFYKLESTPFSTLPNVQLVGKENPILLSPREGELRSSFYAILTFTFREWV
jgi:hypothetical protein